MYSSGAEAALAEAAVNVPDCLDDPIALSARLNADCHCGSIDRPRFLAGLDGPVVAAMIEARPHLLANVPVYAATEHVEEMAAIVAIIDKLAGLPAWQSLAMARAPAIAGHDCGARGVFFGFDFHLDAAGPRLIEVNTNAGGALLCAHLATACPEGSGCLAAEVAPSPSLADLEAEWVAMFREEWRLARGDCGTLRSIAILDEQPAKQFLYPEFELFRQLFERAGIEAMIADPADLVFDGKVLRCRGRSIDLVYNRITDFYLEAAQHAPLSDAFLANRVVLTPHPRAHALYADKRNLVVWGDRQWLEAAGLEADEAERLAGAIPRTVEVTAENADELWADRKRWFFKPNAGYGSRATYRGDKMTRRVFEEIRGGAYVAQHVAPPSERCLKINDALVSLKLDLRNYAYRGRVQLLAARLYQGQTTNMRTPGGGFAPVVSIG